VQFKFQLHFNQEIFPKVQQEQAFALWLSEACNCTTNCTIAIARLHTSDEEKQKKCEKSRGLHARARAQVCNGRAHARG
jgi:hypothetical protein